MYNDTEQQIREQIAKEIMNATFSILNDKYIVPDDLKDNVKPVWTAAQLAFADVARGKRG